MPPRNLMGNYKRKWVYFRYGQRTVSALIWGLRNGKLWNKIFLQIYSSMLKLCEYAFFLNESNFRKYWPQIEKI